ncbi:MAG TPA: hypothetical protein VF508_10065 [Pyrinomonadaceae bacterium]|jgi:hypothetical protein
MNQATVTMLLSRLITQVEGQYGGDARPEFADRLAQSAWSGLVMLLRHSFAQGDELLLEEVGLFSEGEEDWAFRPAATLAEAASLKLPAEEARQRLARQVMFYLDTAAALLRDLPRDVELPATQPTAEEKMYRAVFAQESPRRLLSREVRRVSNSLRRLAAGLEEEEAAENADAEGSFSSYITAVPIELLGLSEATVAALRAHGMPTVGGILRHGRRELLHMIGARALMNVSRALRPYGVHLRGGRWVAAAPEVGAGEAVEDGTFVLGDIIDEPPPDIEFEDGSLSTGASTRRGRRRRWRAGATDSAAAAARGAAGGAPREIEVEPIPAAPSDEDDDEAPAATV